MGGCSDRYMRLTAHAVEEECDSQKTGMKFPRPVIRLTSPLTFHEDDSENREISNALPCIDGRPPPQVRGGRTFRGCAGNMFLL